ncbi:MAG: hypothetical protein HQ552_13785 [Desulfobacteraceae bacterium]|nr:hypothetical protein [Desulfobacteraceae bacterium]
MRLTQFAIVLAVVFTICFIQGCAATSSGVFPIGKNSYTVVVSGSNNNGILIKQAYKEANSFCEEKGKVLQPVATTFQPFVPYGPPASFELRFQVLNPDDPQYRPPIFESVPDTKIEVKN